MTGEAEEREAPLEFEAWYALVCAMRGTKPNLIEKWIAKSAWERGREELRKCLPTG